MRHILIVDDEAAICRLLAGVFTAAGYTVLTATDATEAIRLCATQTVDVVLTDVVMPSMNGHDLVRWLAERHPTIRAVLMTGFDLDCEVCPFSARCKTLAKPFRPGDALSLVERILCEPSANSAPGPCCL